MRIIDKATTFGLIVGSRGFFNAELAVDVRAKLLGILEDRDYDYVITPEPATIALFGGALALLARRRRRK